MRRNSARIGCRRRLWVAAAFRGAALSIALIGCSEPPPSAPGPVDPPTEPPTGLSHAEWGEHLFRSAGCIACHQVNGRSGVGPPLDGLIGARRILPDETVLVIDEAHLRHALLEPAGAHPSYEGILSEAEVDALVAFLIGL